MTDTQSGTETAQVAAGAASGSSTADGASVGDDAAGRSAVGRATVPGDLEKTAGGTPKYVRAPGMAPPPDSLTVPIQQTSAVPHLGGFSVGGVSVGGAPVSGAPVSGAPVSGAPVSGVPVSGGPTATGTASVPAGPAVARASVKTGGATGTRTSGSGAGSGPSGATRVTEAVRAARATVTAAAGRGPRRARLHVKRIDPWSVMKFAFAVSFVLFVVVIIATSVLYVALDAMGVFESVNKALGDLINSTGGEDDGGLKITAKGVIGGAALLGLVNVVLFTALATLGAFIYNVCADLVGGVELTLAEKD